MSFMMSCLDPTVLPTGIQAQLAELPASVRVPIEQELAECIAQRESVYADAVAAQAQAQAEAAAAAAPPLAPQYLADGSPNPEYIPAMVQNILGGGYNTQPCPPLTPEAHCYYGPLGARIRNAHRELRPELYVSPERRGLDALRAAHEDRFFGVGGKNRERLFASMGIAAVLGFLLARRI